MCTSVEHRTYKKSVDIEETVSTRAAECGGDARSGRECRDRVPLTGDPRFPPASFYFSLHEETTSFAIRKRSRPDWGSPAKSASSVCKLGTARSVNPQCVALF